MSDKNDYLKHNGKSVTAYGVGADGVVAFMTKDEERFELQLNEFLTGDFQKKLKLKVMDLWQSLYDAVESQHNLPYKRNGDVNIATGEHQYIVAPTRKIFRDFCKQHGLNPSHASHIDRAEQLYGLDGTGKRLICLPGAGKNVLDIKRIARARGFEILI